MPLFGGDSSLGPGEPLTSSGESIDDSSIRVSVEHFLKGPFHNCDKYSVTLEITNKTDAMLMIPRAEIYFINEEVQERVKGFPVLDYGAFCQLNMENPGHGFLLPRETKKIEADAAAFIPRSIYVSLHHSGPESLIAGELSVSKEEDVEYWNQPKHLDLTSVGIGIDGLTAYREGAEIASEYLESCGFCFATWMHHTATRQGNGLDLISVDSWFLLYSEPNSENVVLVNSDSSGTRGQLVSFDSVREYASFLRTCSQRPVRTSYLEALRLVDSLGLIYDNVCNPLWLDAAGLVGGELHPVWCLPYVGKDYFQLFVDAYSGELLSLDLLYQQLDLGPPWLYHEIAEPDTCSGTM